MLRVRCRRVRCGDVCIADELRSKLLGIVSSNESSNSSIIAYPLVNLNMG